MGIETTVRALYSSTEWEQFEDAVRAWLGAPASTATQKGRLQLDGALLAATPRTEAATVKAWMSQTGLHALARRIDVTAFADCPDLSAKELAR